MPAKKKRLRKKTPSLRDVTADKVPAFTDWRTSDDDEKNRRLLRALDEKPRVINLTPEHPVYSNFEVQSPSGMTYEVEVREVEPRQCHCTCTDFRINGLGTCKHVEAVILYLQGKLRKRLFQSTVEKGSDRVDLVPDVDRQSLRLITRRRLSGSLQRLFDDDKRLLTSIPIDEALEDLAGCRVKGFRISIETEAWHHHYEQALESRRLRREYEQKVQSGEYPAHETKVPLYPYQREGMLHLAFTGRAMVADEMGLGKTIQAIAACALLHRLGKARRVLIVAPASLKTEWEEQITQFTNLSYQIVYGPKRRRLSNYQNHEPFFTLVNYEQIRPDGLDINEHHRPDIIVLDEAQRIKNWNTLTARAVKRLESRYAFVLTGTPIENRIDELYSIVDFLDPTLLGPLFRFNRDYYQLDERGRPEGYRNLAQLHERVKPVMLRRLKRDVETELPERTDRNHFVEMSQVQRDSYQDHQDTVARIAAMAKTRPLRKEEQERLMRHLAMMRMLCDTCYILDPDERTCPKVDELEKVLDEYLAEPDVKVIIFSEWVRMLELVRELVKKLALGYAWHTGSVPQHKRRDEIRAFKTDPDCRVFLCSESGGVGLNLQNASVVVNCDLPWNPAKLEQRIARAWRKHQTRPVTVINLVSKHTIEHGMLGTLAAKRSLAQGVLDLEGDLDKISMKRGGSAFVEKLEQVMSKADALKQKDKQQQQKPRTASMPSDPGLAFGTVCRDLLGDRLVRCEEHFPQSEGAPTALVVVVDPLTPEIEVQILDQYKALFRTKPGDKKQPTTLQVIDRDTADAIAKMQQCGLLQSTTRAIRPLAVGDDSEAAASAFTKQEEQRMTELGEEASNKLKMAMLLEGGGFPKEAHQPLLEALLRTASLLAVRERLPEPDDLATVLQPPFLRLWQGNDGPIRAFVDSNPVSASTIAPVLKRLLTAPARESQD